MDIALKPLLDEPAMVVESEYKILVLADLHLGIEVELRQKGIHIGSQTDKLLERAIKCVKAVEPDAILLLGDIKHVVPQMSFADRKEVPFFFAQLRKIQRDVHKNLRLHPHAESRNNRRSQEDIRFPA